MGVLGKDLFDLHRPQTNTKVEFGASAYWVEDRPMPQPYGAVLTEILNLDVAPFQELLDRLNTAVQEKSGDVLRAYMEMKKGLASLPLYRLYLEDFRVFGDMPVEEFVVGDAQDAFAEFIMQEDNDLPAFMQQQISDIRLIQERYAWFLDGVFADAVFEKKKGQKKIPLAPMICSRGYEAFISGVSLGENPETDAPPVKTQYRIRGEKENAVPVYTGGKINAANNAAKIKVENAAQKETQARNGLVSELTERYYGLALAMQVVEVRKQVLDGMRHHLSDAVALENNGIIAKGERLYAEVHTAEAEREYLKAQKTVETLKSALGSTLNSEESVSPASDMFILSDIEGADYFKQCAFDRNPLLRQVSYAKRLATENMRLQRSEFAPQVALMGIASLYNYQVSSIMPKWAVGAGVSFKIFDGLHREYKFSAARWQIRQAEAVGEQAHNNMLTLIDKLYNEMVTYSQQLPSVDASYRFATEYLRIKDEAFKEGAAPSSDVVDARLNLAKIKIERLQAAYYYDLMLARLLEAAGISEAFSDYAKRSAAMPIRFEDESN